MNKKKYINGFNSGYIMATYIPDLLNSITLNLRPTTDYLEGIFDGKLQRELENMREQVQIISDIRSNTNNKDREI